LLNIPAWNIIQNFCCDWEDPQSSLHKKLLNIWLEFDVGESQAPYIPSIFFGTLPPDEEEDKNASSIIIDALSRLVPEALEGQRGKQLFEVFNLLPAQAYIFQVGVMLSRKLPAIRICIRNIEPSKIVSSLIAMGWTGSVDRLSQVTEEISDYTTSIDIDIDVGETIGDKIGMECSFGHDQQTPEKLRNFTEWLIRNNMTSEEKAKALVSFHGLIHQDTDPDKWPQYAQKIAALLGNDVIHIIPYYVNHIKVVYQEGKSLSAKAYLAFKPDRTTRSFLSSHKKTTSQ
jgi:hypothetical protein